MSADDHIDKLFRERLGGRKFIATDADWKDALDLIEHQDAQRPKGYWKWWIGALALIGTATFLFMDHGPSTQNEVASIKQSTEQTSSDVPANSTAENYSGTTTHIENADHTSNEPASFDAGRDALKNENVPNSKLAKASPEGLKESKNSIKQPSTTSNTTRINQRPARGSKDDPNSISVLVNNTTNDVTSTSDEAAASNGIAQTTSKPDDQPTVIENTFAPDPISVPESSSEDVLGAVETEIPTSAHNGSDQEGEAAVANSSEVTPIPPTGENARTTYPVAKQSAELVVAEVSDAHHEPGADIAGVAEAAFNDSIPEQEPGLTLADSTVAPPIIAKPAFTPVSFTDDLLLHAHGGLLFSNARGGNNSEVANLVEQGSSIHSMPYFGFDVMLPIAGISLGAGLHLTQYGERTEIPAYSIDKLSFFNSTVNFPAIDSVLNPSDSVWTYYTYLGSMEVTDTILTTTTRPASTTINRFSYLEIPLMVGHLWEDKRWMYGAQFGVTVGSLTTKQGRYPNEQLTGYDEASELKYRSVTLGYILRPMLHYKLNNHFSIGIEPSIRGHLTDMIQEGPLSGRKYFSYGIGAGVMYRLGKKAATPAE